jgi:predicted  nucleic acid-binding Zn-ribbon protein
MNGRCSRLKILSLALGVPLLSALAVAQEAPAPKENASRLPQQILPTGEEDASARAQDFTARAARSEAQSLEQQLREMTSESTEGLVTIRQDNGSIGMDLQGRFQSVLIAKQTEDGRYVVSCHTGEDARAHAHHAAEIASGKAPKVKPQAPRQSATSRPQVLEEK